MKTLKNVYPIQFISNNQWPYTSQKKRTNMQEMPLINFLSMFILCSRGTAASPSYCLHRSQVYCRHTETWSTCTDILWTYSHIYIQFGSAKLAWCAHFWTDKRELECLERTHAEHAKSSQKARGRTIKPHGLSTGNSGNHWTIVLCQAENQKRYNQCIH